MQYNEINKEGLNEEVGRVLTDSEYAEFIRQVEKFVSDTDFPTPTQDEVDEFIMNLAYDFGQE